MRDPRLNDLPSLARKHLRIQGLDTRDENGRTAVAIAEAVAEHIKANPHLYSNGELDRG